MKNQKGITLVALIITIIVMLILAGVAISTAIGDNGVITQTQAAIKEQERADVQDIIIGSYVFKVTGSFNSFAYIDIDKTGIAIYDNLKANGFEVKDPITVDDGNGNNVLSAPIVKDEDNNSIGIEVTVKGDHGEYFGKVESNGLVGNVIEKEIEEDPPITPEELTDLERLIAYFKDEVILDSSTGLGLVNTSTGKFDQAKEGILTSEQAQSIIFTPVTEIPPVGEIVNILIKYNNVKYILSYTTVEEDGIEKIKGLSVNIYEEPEYLLYYRPTDESDGREDVFFINNNDLSVEYFIGLEDVFIPVSKSTMSYEFDGNVLKMNGIKIGEIDENLILNYITGQKLEPQTLPIELKEIIKIYDTEDALEENSSYKKSYGLLADGTCYHLYRVNDYYIIISNGTVEYTIENDKLKVEQINEQYEGNNTFKEYIIGTEAIESN